MSSTQKSFKIDVFMSFCSEDSIFADHLCHALQRGTYEDDERINFGIGKRISYELIRSIEESRAYIVVFSKNYASSPWCLDVLVKIIECQRMTNRTIVPIFYDVEPTHVRNQSGAFGEAFVKHVKEKDAGRWIYALRKAVDLSSSSWVPKAIVDGHESELLKLVVRKISSEIDFCYWSRNSIESTSASSVQNIFKYDVFLSSRVEDTSFADHLYDALMKSDIYTYKGYERIENLRKISDELIKSSIEESRFHIIVFSRNYATSSSALYEIMKIMECQKKTKEQTAYPIFYDVEPSEVANQNGAFGEAFARHEKEEDAGRWRDALKNAAGLAGWQWKTGQEEAKCIDKIVQFFLSNPDIFIGRFGGKFDKKFIGMESRVKNLVPCLEIGFDGTRMIGIKGLGGCGKTTLAGVIFDCLESQFEGRIFVENVRKKSEGSESGLKKLQKMVLREVLNDRNIKVSSISDGKSKMEEMLSSVKALVVLDDVDDLDQLEALAGKLSWFKPGSRIIITTRDEHVLVAHGVHSDNIHDVNVLSHEEAIRLFSRHAFGRDIPVQGYEELSEQIVHYAAGFPITLKVLGLHLAARSKHVWESTLERLKIYPEMYTLKILKLSYDGLEDEQQEIFLDVVCILKGEKKRKAMRILLSCGFNAQIGFRVLEQKSLIISDDHMVLLHDHIEAMGWDIVRRMDHNNPTKHSRLWIKEEIEDILVNKLGTEITRSIKLEGSDLHPAIIMEGLRKMTKLIFLHVDNGYSNWEIDNNSSGTEITRSIKREASNLHPSVVMKGLRKRQKLIFPHVHNRYRNWEIDNSGLYLPNTLRCLHWHHYPFWSLPNTFQANDLVNLEMVRSNITQLWEEGERKILNKLRFLNLSGSKLTRLDLGMTPKLEELNLRKCNDFKELHVSAECRNLNLLILGCPKLTDLNLELIPNLEELHLEECNELIELHMPVQPPKLTLSAKKIKRLPESICMLKHLKFLELESCLLLELLPEDLHRLECLEELYITNCISLRDIPSSICKMKCLKYLHLPYCILVKELPKELGSLKCLKELNIEGSGVRHLPHSIFQLKGLHIIGSRGRLESYGFTSLKEISSYTASCYM